MTAIKKINTKANQIWIDEDGLLLVKTTDGAELDVDEVKACYEAYESLGIGPHNKVFQLMYVNDGAMTMEARTYAAEHIDNYLIASAIISNSLAVRLVVNFLNKFRIQLFCIL